MQHGRGRRGSGKRRLRELTRAIVDTMEILEEVRERHADVGGASKAFVQVVKLGLQTCMVDDPEGPGHHQHQQRRESGNASLCSGQYSGSASSSPSATTSSSTTACSVAGGGMNGGGGAGAGTEESQQLPLGVASVLWELECCAAQARATLMNLNEGRANHFGVFRACVYVQEMRILEKKVLELVKLAANPKEERNASLGRTVAEGIRNCVARLWWARRVGENAESILWNDFTEAFQEDFGEQLSTTLDSFRKHIATRGHDVRPKKPPMRSSPPLPRPQSRTVGLSSMTAAAAAAAGTAAVEELQGGSADATADRGVAGEERGSGERDEGMERRTAENVPLGAVPAKVPHKFSRTAPARATAMEDAAASGSVGKMTDRRERLGFQVDGGSLHSASEQMDDLAAAVAATDIGSPTLPVTAADNATHATDACGHGDERAEGGGTSTSAYGASAAATKYSAAVGSSSNAVDPNAADGGRGGTGAAGVRKDPGTVFAATAAAIEASTAASVAALALVELGNGQKTSVCNAATNTVRKRSITGTFVEAAGATPAGGGVGAEGGGDSAPSEVKADGEWEGEPVMDVEHQRIMGETQAELEGNGDEGEVKDGGQKMRDSEVVVAQQQRGSSKFVPAVMMDTATVGIGRTPAEDAPEATARHSVLASSDREIAAAAKKQKRQVQATAGSDDWVICQDLPPTDATAATTTTSTGNMAHGSAGTEPRPGNDNSSVASYCPGNETKGDRYSAAGDDEREGNGEEEVGDGKWWVSATKYEQMTWKYGGLYEAFQALTDPRRVVYSMGVVDDGPHHEGDGDDARPVVVEGLLGLSVRQVCCGGQHAAVLTDCGAIYTWGRGGFGRLGHGDIEPTDKPRRIEALEGITCVQVACGFAYTAAVTASGELYTWGAGENGRLGLGDLQDRHTPSRVDGLHSKVKEVYAGSVHSCVLTREGTVYSFGKHEYTGHGDVHDVLEPRLIPAFSGGSEAIVRQISVGPGGYHTCALTCQGEVYAWGHNRVAQLGIGNSFTVPRNSEGAYFLPSPQLVESLLGVNIVKVVAGWGHSAALTMGGQVYVCGRNYQGQLGLGSPQRFPQNERGHAFQADFCLIERLSHLKITQIACGGEHSVAVAENGEVWSFGAGQKGQLGHETTEREDFPRLVERLKSTRREILHVACGNNCTLVLAGGEAFPSLFERSAAVVRGNPALWADVEALGLLPPSMVDCLNGRAEGGAGGRVVLTGMA